MISEPIKFSAQAASIVNAYNSSSSKDPGHWERPENSSVREEIKKYYIECQAGLCCYCAKSHPPDNLRHWDGEHIMAKALYPEYLYEPRNLAAACPTCNLWKSDFDVLIRPSPKNYPRSSAKFSLIHPHVDEYSDHISLHLGFVYVPKTRKGAKTIDVCYLGRFAVQLAGWDDRLKIDKSLLTTLKIAIESDSESESNAAVAQLLLVAQVQLSRTLLPSGGI